jgi:hypothetical protein
MLDGDSIGTTPVGPFESEVTKNIIGRLGDMAGMKPKTIG